MKSGKKEYFLGGSGEKWNATIIAQEIDGRGFRLYCIEFNAEDTQKAKEVSLEQVQKIWKRYKNPNGWFIMLTTAPRLRAGGLDGDRMIRMKHKFCHGADILTIKNPNIPFIIGYGPNQAKQLSQ